MSVLIDVTGKVFGKITVLRVARVLPNRQIMWACKCECGVEKEMSSSPLRRGIVLSGGCHRRNTKTKHGQAKQDTSEYRVWASMKNRCNNPKNKGYKNYGGRGITVCKEWADSFEAFFSDMGKKPSPNHSIERIRNNEGYGPHNCVWETPVEQSRNRRSTVFIERNGLKLCIKDWATRWGLWPNSIRGSMERHGTFDYIYEKYESKKNKNLE